VSDSGIPPALVDGLLKLCQGDFKHRLPRTWKRDEEDTIAFFINSIAAELERILDTSKAKEVRLSGLVDQLSKALIKVAAGNFGTQVQRDFAGDSADVLAFLVNSTITELGKVVAASQRRADEDRLRLERLVAERTAELERVAVTDTLTGVFNRGRIFEVAADEASRASRQSQPLCLAMLDLDHFKAINDRHGHVTGDDVLRVVAQCISRELRPADRIGRYGGEEFLVLLPETALAGAVAALERVRNAVSQLKIEAIEGVQLTVSAGVVVHVNDAPLEASVKRADAALYRAKAEGRNRVVAEAAVVKVA
jgi:diguanylate cyclase (GGDEF)-like protein